MVALVLARAPGGDVDHAEHGLRAIQDRAGPQDHLDVVHHVDRDVVQVGRTASLLVHHHAVEYHQDVAVRVPRKTDPACADLGSRHTVAGKHAEREKIDSLVETTNAEQLQLLGGDHGGQRGCVALALRRA
jgi:hypothetical protein